MAEEATAAHREDVADLQAVEVALLRDEPGEVLDGVRAAAADGALAVAVVGDVGVQLEVRAVASAVGACGRGDRVVGHLGLAVAGVRERQTAHAARVAQDAHGHLLGAVGGRDAANDDRLVCVQQLP